jgi:hypothetical protein
VGYSLQSVGQQEGGSVASCMVGSFEFFSSVCRRDAHATDGGSLQTSINSTAA